MNTETNLRAAFKAAYRAARVAGTANAVWGVRALPYAAKSAAATVFLLRSPDWNRPAPTLAERLAAYQSFKTFLG